MRKIFRLTGPNVAEALLLSPLVTYGLFSDVIEPTGDGVVLTVYTQPRASKTEFVGGSMVMR